MAAQRSAEECAREFARHAIHVGEDACYEDIRTLAWNIGPRQILEAWRRQRAAVAS